MLSLDLVDSRNGYPEALAQLFQRSVRVRSESVTEPDWTVFAEMELFRLSRDERYLVPVAEAIRTRLLEYNRKGIVPGRLTVFKMPVRIGYAARLLVAEGVFGVRELRHLRQFLMDLLLHAKYERGAMNRAVGFMAALHPIFDVIGEHPRARDLRSLKSLILSDWTGRWEPVEDAYGYEAITLLFVLIWFEESARDQLIRCDQMRATLDRLLQARSSDGTGVAFGDWRPNDRVPGHYLAIVERAASVLGDGRFRWIADRLWRSWSGRLGRGGAASPEALFGLAFASRWSEIRVDPVAPDTGSAVLRRNDGEASKLVVRHGWQPDGLFAMVSLAHGHEHSHNDALAVNAIMRGGTTLLGDNGRNRPEQRAHNLLATGEHSEELFESGSRVPHNTLLNLQFAPQAGRGWGHFSKDSSIPIESGHFVANDIPSAFDYDPGQQSVFCFGVTGSGQAELVVSDFALDGPAGRLNLLDARGAGWGDGAPADDGTVRFKFDLDAENPYAAFEGFAVSHAGRVLPSPLVLAADEFNSIELVLRLDAGDCDADIHFICIGDRECVPKKWKIADSPQGSATVEDFDVRPGRTRARLLLKDRVWSGRTRTRTRDVIASGTRVVSVYDTVAYEDSKPFVAAVLWHSRREPVHLGDGWYLVGDEAPLLVGFPSVSDPSGAADLISWVYSDDPERHNPYTLFRSRSSDGLRTERFETLILAPLPGEQSSTLLPYVSMECDTNGYNYVTLADNIE